MGSVDCVLQTLPTDMRALQDFEEDDKLQIKANDVITIIEGRSVHAVTLFSQVVSLYGASWFFTLPSFCPLGRNTIGGEVRTDGRCAWASFHDTW